MPAPLISVVIPAFNREKEIARAIDSALRQDLHSIEVLVVDDCSRDRTVDAVEAVQDPRLRLVRRPSNGGASAARNTGIEAAAGDYIAFLDSDDSWMPDKLSRNMAFIHRVGLDNGQRWVAYNRVEVRTELGSRVSQASPAGRVTVAELLFCNLGFVQTSAVFLPRWVAQENPFSENVAWVDDWDFLLKLERSGASIHFQDDVLTVHNAFSSATRMSNNVKADALARWLDSQRPFLTEREVAGFNAHRVAPQLTLSGRRVAAMKLLVKAMALGAVRPRAFAVELARAALPRTVFDSLRAVARG